MNRIKPSVVLDDAYRLNGWDASQLDDRDVADARGCFSLAVQEVWESWWWYELMLCAQTQFASTYSTAISGAPVGWYYWPLTDGYFYKIEQPYNFDPTDADGNVDFFRWYEYVETESPPNWSATSTYTAGDRVLYAGVKYHARVDSGLNQIPGVSSDWVEVAEWTPTVPYLDYLGAEAGPTGAVRSVSRLDPRRTCNPGFFRFEPTGDGTLVFGLEVGRPFIWSRLPTAIITGDPFDDDLAYSVDEQCYFLGDFWVCVTATSDGESPVSHSAKWDRIDLPSQWRWVLARITYAGLLELDGQKDKANDERQLALARENVGLNDLIRQQANRATWRSRPEVGMPVHC